MRCKLADIRATGLIALAGLVLLYPQSASAQSPTPTPASTPAAGSTPTPKPTAGPTASPAQTATSAAPTPTPVDIRVLEVSGELALFNTVTVKVDKLAEYLKQPGKDSKKFVLYLDWRPLKGITPRQVDGDNALMFDIERTPDSRESWNKLLGRPFWGDRGWTYKVPVSIGYDNEAPIPTNVDNDKKWPLVVVNQIGFWVFLVAFGLSLYSFWRLAKHKGILRDPCPDLPAKDRPYSLGRTQMAFWFFVIAASYVLIWLITSDRNSLTEQALGLLGISTATALGAAVVGANKNSADESKRKALEQEEATLTVRSSQFAAEQSALPDKLSELNKEKAEKTARLEQVKKELAALTKQALPQKSVDFLTDILSDAEGISLHRFQMAIWTVVLGIIFVAGVYNNLAMPELNGTLLALMGISGGTYIGFKFPEKQGSPNSQPPAA
jgi:hypothetical protein